MSEGYANLEWAASDRQSLKGAYDRARTGLDNAQDVTGARLVLNQFVTSFGDGHLALRWPAAQTSAAGPATTPSPCDQLGRGFAGDRRGFLDELQGFEPIATADSAVIAAGVIAVDGRRFGILRIPGFGHSGLPEICDQAALSLPEGDCDEDCRDRLYLAASDLYLAIIERQIQALKARTIDLLLVDVSSNGGGDDTAEAIARMVTERPLRSGRIGMMRTTAWRDRLTADIDGLRQSGRNASGADRAALDAIIAGIEAARAETERPCDRSPLWRDEPVACSQLIPTPLYATGWVDGHDTTSLQGRAWARTTYTPAGFRSTPGMWTGPVAVLVDHGTASAAEQFASVLKDNGAGTIIGVPTFGAGCGHWLDPEPVRLAQSGGILSMPDCVRLRADGSNEVAGIEPDLLVPFRRNDSRRQKATRLRRFLENWPASH